MTTIILVIHRIARTLPLRVWIGIGIIALIVGLFGAYKFQEARANRAVTEARTAAVTADALDRVNTQTDGIRAEQQEKQNEVDSIPGSSDRLPDGYGADLQRVRDGKRKNP